MKETESTKEVRCTLVEVPKAVGEVAKLGAIIRETDYTVHEHTKKYGVELNPPYSHGPFVIVRTLTNDETTYGTFSKKCATCEGDTASTDSGVKTYGHNGDNVVIPVVGKALDEVKWSRDIIKESSHKGTEVVAVGGRSGDAGYVA